MEELPGERKVVLGFSAGELTQDMSRRLRSRARSSVIIEEMPLSVTATSAGVELRS